MKLKGRVALITAAGSGMGRASAELFASEGAHAIVVDRDPEAAERTVKAITDAGGSASAEQTDVSKVDELEALFARVERDHGVLHVLFNHAGIPGAAGIEMTEAEWQLSVDVNMKSAFFATSFALPLLRKADGHGSVIFTASTTGLVGSPYSPLYSMTKGGVIMFMKGFALMVAKDGIRANAICPGPIETPMLPLFFGRTPTEGGVDNEVRGFIAQAVPVGRPGQPSEIATAALFLASDDSSFVTGVALPVDGGYTAR
jgi:NAD(P)-dependent dehydrogenase (short-subunit alcohol dehydrogenase family)